MLVKYIHDIPRSLSNRNQAKQYLQRHHIFLNDSYHNYMLEEIECRDKLDYKRNICSDGE